jgi:hypothetical protein
MQTENLIVIWSDKAGMQAMRFYNLVSACLFADQNHGIVENMSGELVHVGQEIN